MNDHDRLEWMYYDALAEKATGFMRWYWRFRMWCVEQRGR